MYSETCLNWHALGEKFGSGVDCRVLEYKVQNTENYQKGTKNN